MEGGMEERKNEKHAMMDFKAVDDPTYVKEK